MEKLGTRLLSGIAVRTVIYCGIYLRTISHIYNEDFGFSMYADDHQVYVKGKDICTVFAKLLVLLRQNEINLND